MLYKERAVGTYSSEETKKEYFLLNGGECATLKLYFNILLHTPIEPPKYEFHLTFI
jgi:hypothetical protein